MDATISEVNEFENTQGKLNNKGSELLRVEVKSTKTIQGVSKKIETRYLFQLEGYFQGNILDMYNNGKVVANFELRPNNLKKPIGQISIFAQFLNLVMVDLKKETSPRSKKSR